MKPKDAFGRYGCVPREMHPAWQRVSYFARALGRDLISRVDDFDTMRIETSGEWRSSLCLSLCINGPERRNAKAALHGLVDAGLLAVGDGFVTVGLQPLGSCSAVGRQSVGSRSVSVPVPDSNQVVENTQVTSDSKQAIKAIEASERARARESSARFEKPPVGEAPPELPKPTANPPSWLRVWQLFAEHRGLDPLQLGHPGRQQEALQSIAGAAEVEAGGSEGVDWENAVRRLLGAWSADKWVKEKQPTLANLAANLHRYSRPRLVKVSPLAPEETYEATIRRADEQARAAREERERTDPEYAAFWNEHRAMVAKMKAAGAA